MYYVFTVTRLIALIAMPLLALASAVKAEWGWLLLAIVLFGVWLPKVPRY